MRSAAVEAAVADQLDAGVTTYDDPVAAGDAVHVGPLGNDRGGRS
jgi:hypothetical protein